MTRRIVEKKQREIIKKGNYLMQKKKHKDRSQN